MQRISDIVGQAAQAARALLTRRLEIQSDGIPYTFEGLSRKIAHDFECGSNLRPEQTPLEEPRNPEDCYYLAGLEADVPAEQTT